MTLDHQFYFKNGFWWSELYGKVVLLYFLGLFLKFISFNPPIDSGSIIKPCTLKLFQVPILAPGLHSNGFAEAAVKAMKTLMQQCWEINLHTVNADKWVKGATPHGQTAYPQPKWCMGTQYATPCLSTSMLSPLSGSAPSRRPMSAPPPYTTGLSICTIEPLMNYHSSPWAPKWLYKTATIWSVLPVGGFGDVTEDSSVVATLWPTQTLPTLCPTL